MTIRQEAPIHYGHNLRRLRRAQGLTRRAGRLGIDVPATNFALRGTAEDR